jgi:hypothetical protein
MSRFVKRKADGEQQEHPDSVPQTYQVIKTSLNSRLREPRLYPYILAAVDCASLATIRGSRIFNAFVRHLADTDCQKLEAIDAGSVRSILTFAWTNAVAKNRQRAVAVLGAIGFGAWWDANEHAFDAYAPSTVCQHHETLVRELNLKRFTDASLQAYQRCLFTVRKSLMSSSA